MNKKGMVEIQFNWIYVGVVGAIILIVAGSIVINIQKNSKIKLERSAINYFDNMFTSMQASENTEHSVVLPGMAIEITTPENEEDIEECNYYNIKGSAIDKKSIEYVPIFSPNVVEKKILSFSLGWDSPFRANYFLYMTSPDIAYVVVGEQKKLMEDLPNHMTKKTTEDMSSFKEQKYYSIRYILFNKDPERVSSGVAKLKDKQVSAIKVMPTAGIYDGGQIIFYKKKGSNFVEDRTVRYVDKATLFAAIYSESAYSYECNIMKAVKRLREVSGILKTRANVIKNSGLLYMCQTSDYDLAYSLLDKLEKETTPENFDMNTLKSSMKELNSLNSEINKKSCPTIY